MAILFDRVSTVGYLAVISVLMLRSGEAYTQPNAGELLQQIQRELEQELPEKGTKSIAPSEQAILPTPQVGPTIIVNRFVFKGNTLLSSKDLASLLEPYLNKPLSFAELKGASKKVAEAYRESGWIVRAFLPQQDVVGGEITIQIVEAKFGQIRMQGEAPASYSLDKVLAHVSAVQNTREVIKTDSLDRALLLLNDLPGIAVTGSLARGANLNETDLVLKVTDDKPYFGDFSVDNAGSFSTGSKRVQVNGGINSPFNKADKLGANVLLSEGTRYLGANYTLPLDYNGLRLGVSGSKMNYEIVEGKFVGLNLQGESTSAAVNLFYPVVRSRNKNLYLSGSLNHKDFYNTSGGTVTTNYHSNNLSLSLYGNLFDQLGGGGANSFSLSLTRGDLTLEDNDNRTGALAEIAGPFSKVNFSFSRQQFLTNSLSLYASLSGQKAFDRLDSSEQFFLGGANGVRAYPANEGGGSDGFLVKLELRKRYDKDLVVSGFYDYGHVANRDVVPESYGLSGLGVSLDWAVLPGANLNTTWAHRIGENPNSTTTGSDQDSTLDRHRFWASFVMSY